MDSFLSSPMPSGGEGSVASTRDRRGAKGEAGPTNLSSQPSSFVGREQEVVEVTGLLAEGRSAPRLLTLTGAAGGGKTRLALAAAAGLPASYPDGIWLVELAALADPGLVAQAVAATLGVRESAG